MFEFISRIEEQLLSLASTIPVDLFVILGSFVEEIIAPIPSPLVMMTAGIISFEQGFSWIGIVYLAVIGAFFKTIASVIFYFIVDKLEDVILGKWGKFFGIEHEFVEQIGKKLHKGAKDYMTMFWLRALPFVPTAPISLLGGFFKVDLKAYIVGSFFGLILRNLFYLYIGFAGLEFIDVWSDGLSTIENYVQIIIVVLLFGGVVWYKLRKRKRKR